MDTPRRTWKDLKPLTDEQVHAIRMSRGVRPARELAIEHDRSIASIVAVWSYQVYKLVPLTDAERARLANTPRILRRYEPRGNKRKDAIAVLTLITKAQRIARKTTNADLAALVSAITLVRDAVAEITKPR